VTGHARKILNFKNIRSRAPLHAMVQVSRCAAGAEILSHANVLMQPLAGNSCHLKTSSCSKGATNMPAKSTNIKHPFPAALYQKTSDDLHLSGCGKRTHDSYLREIRKLSEQFRLSPDKVSEQHSGNTS
jgi:hypothetical protein